MRYIDNRVLDLNIAYIGGGSREWAWRLMSDLALEDHLAGCIRLYDLDHEAACDNKLNKADNGRSTAFRNTEPEVIEWKKIIKGLLNCLKCFTALQVLKHMPG